MADSLTDIATALATLEAKLTATIADERKRAKQVERDHLEKGKIAAARHVANAAAASAERKEVLKALRRLRRRDKPCVTKAEFVDKCFSLLTDNTGTLGMSDLVGLVKDHFRHEGYSMACLDTHVPKYLAGDPRWSLSGDGQVSLTSRRTGNSE